jgi:hypothetical protein
MCIVATIAQKRGTDYRRKRQTTHDTSSVFQYFLYGKKEVPAGMKSTAHGAAVSGGDEGERYFTAEIKPL